MMGKGCLAPVAFVLVAALAVWFFQDYPSFEQFMLNMAARVVDLALALAELFIEFVADLRDALVEQESGEQ